MSTNDINFLKDLLQELASMADASDYYKGEVNQAFELLDQLDKLSVEEYLKLNESRISLK